MIPPNTSSEKEGDGPDPAAAEAPEQGADTGLKALVARLAEEFGADVQTLLCVATVFEDVRERAPDLFVPAAGALAPAFAAIVAAGGSDAAPVHAALGE